MANLEHVAIIKQGVAAWNKWRKENPDIHPDLSGADLHGMNLIYAYLNDVDLSHSDLSEANLPGALLHRANLGRANLIKTTLINASLERASLYLAMLGETKLSNSDLHKADLSSTTLKKVDLSGANLSLADLSDASLESVDFRGANLTGTNLSNADLTEPNLSGAYLEAVNLSGARLVSANFANAYLYEANLSGAYLSGANLNRAHLMKADLSGTNLSKANLSEAFLRSANLSKANLSGAILVRADLTKAVLNACIVYGVAAWDVQLEDAIQLNLIITPPNEPIIAVDNLKIAQFVYLLINNADIREAIDTIVKKAVLILGRFTPEHKTVLDALRKALRTHGYLPILFDFDKPTSRDITETVSTLAHLSRFIIADITDAKSIPQELMAIVPSLPSVPVQPLLLASQHEYGMFEHFTRYPWVLPTYHYIDEESLLQSLKEKVIAPAEQKAQELAKR